MPKDEHGPRKRLCTKKAGQTQLLPAPYNPFPKAVSLSRDPKKPQPRGRYGVQKPQLFHWKVFVLPDFLRGRLGSSPNSRVLSRLHFPLHQVHGLCEGRADQGPAAPHAEPWAGTHGAWASWLTSWALLQPSQPSLTARRAVRGAPKQTLEFRIQHPVHHW